MSNLCHHRIKIQQCDLQIIPLPLVPEQCLTKTMKTSPDKDKKVALGVKSHSRKLKLNRLRACAVLSPMAGSKDRTTATTKAKTRHFNR